MVNTIDGFQTAVTGSDDEDGDSLTVSRSAGQVMLWIETCDGEASVHMTQTAFNEFVENTRNLMRWPA